MNVLAINYGSAFASLAIIDNDGKPSCIAEESGNRQIAAAIAYSGEQYMGNQATPQLLKNAENTIMNFRDMLGKSFEACQEIQKGSAYEYAPLVRTDDGQVAFRVTVSPTDPKKSPMQKLVTPYEANALFLKTLVASGSDYIGHKVDSIILALPQSLISDLAPSFEMIANELGLNLLQIVPDAVAAIHAYSPLRNVNVSTDENVLVLDVGARSSTATVVAARDGLYSYLNQEKNATLGGDTIDRILLEHFAAQFSAKTKTPFDVEKDVRPTTKLRFQCDSLKRSLAASHSANLAIESLKNGIDFTDSINRSKLDILCGLKVYRPVVDLAQLAIEKAGLDNAQISRVLFVGGVSALSGVSSAVKNLFEEDKTTFPDVFPSDQVIALGAAAQAIQFMHPLDPAEVKGISDESVMNACCLSTPIVLAPNGLQGQVCSLFANKTPLPVHRSFEIPVTLKKDQTKGQVCFSICEGKEEIEMVPATPFERSESDDGMDDEEEELEDVPEMTLKAAKVIVEVAVPVESVSAKTALPVHVTITIDVDGKMSIKAHQTGAEPVMIEVN